jgi:hypothetical protein
VKDFSALFLQYSALHYFKGIHNQNWKTAKKTLNVEIVKMSEVKYYHIVKEDLKLDNLGRGCCYYQSRHEKLYDCQNPIWNLNSTFWIDLRYNIFLSINHVAIIENIALDIAIPNVPNKES